MHTEQQQQQLPQRTRTRTHPPQRLGPLRLPNADVGVVTAAQHKLQHSALA